MPAVAPQMLNCPQGRSRISISSPPKLRRRRVRGRRVEQVTQRRLEGAGHFRRIEHQREARPHQADDGRHAVAADDGVVRQAAEHFDELAAEPDLLARFAQRRRGGVGIAGFQSPAGEGDLTGMVLEVGGAQRQKHRQLRRRDP